MKVKLNHLNRSRIVTLNTAIITYQKWIYENLKSEADRSDREELIGKIDGAALLLAELWELVKNE